MTLRVWYKKAVIHIVVRADFNILVVGVRIDEVREFKLKPARQTLYLPALVDGVRIINCYKYERLIGCCLKQIIDCVWI